MLSDPRCSAPQACKMSQPPTKCEPVWCMVGNIVEERPYGEGGAETRIGTKHFSPGTKVYCFPPLWGDGYENIKVIGYHKGTRGRQLVVMVIKSAWIENRRAELVYKPSIISRFDGAWDGSLESKRLAMALAGEEIGFRWIRECWNAFRRILHRMVPNKQRSAEQSHALELAAGPDSSGESSPPTQ
jgi:hypothetical protein